MRPEHRTVCETRAGPGPGGFGGRVRKPFGALVALACLWVLPASAAADTRFALIVGHNLGDIHETPLRWAESDATRVGRVLTEIGDIRPDRTTLLLSPTVAEFEKARLTMEGRLLEAKHRGERTVFLVYFSGHADEEELHFGQEKLNLDELQKDLQEGAATTVVAIIDACRNDRNPRVKTKGATRAPSFSWPREGPSAPAGFVRLSSASEGEVAQESDDLQGSLFTHHLLSGMRGSADLDRDGTVTLNELYRYGYARTLEDSHGQTTAVQHSELEVALSGRGALIVTYPRRAISTLEFGEDVQGHLLIIDDASGRIVAEVHRDGALPTRMAVAPGRYRIQLRGEEEIRSGLVSLGSGNRRVELSELDVQPVLAVLTKGPQYDPHPYLLSIGGGAGHALVDGFGVAPSLALGFDYRLSAAFRMGLRIVSAYAGATNALWQYRQLELEILAGLEWAAFFTEDLAFIVGVRAGLAGVVQQGDRRDAERLEAGGVTGTGRMSRSFGPKTGGVVGLEYHPWTQVGLRLEAEPGVWWLRADNSTSARYGVNGTLALMVRL